MSYARWTHGCDVYVYETEDGFQCHVARSRWEIPEDASWPSLPENGTVDEIINVVVERSEILRNACLVPNGIDLDVWSYTRPTGPEMADLLEALRERGVQFDDSLLEALREEPS